MKHSLEELLGLVYRYTPRGLPFEDPRYKDTEAYRRLSAARRDAHLHRDAWNGLFRRLRAAFPETPAIDTSHPLSTGDHDASYSGSIFLRAAAAPGDPWHAVTFRVSILCPYYVVYGKRVDIDPATAHPPPGWYDRITISTPDGSELMLPAHVTPERAGEIASHLGIAVGDLHERMDAARRRRKEEWQPLLKSTVCLDLSPDEHPYAEWLAREIEATFGAEPMPPDIGNVIVADVATNMRALGEARLYDCLLSDDW
jgi:hypothetical protein